MNLKAFWICLLAGCLLFLYGIRELYLRGEWMLFFLAILITAFSGSAILKRRKK